MKLNIKKPKLTSYQKDILYNPSRFTITEASTKVGKTFSHIWWLFEKAHSSEAKSGYNYWWVAPTYSQSKIAFKRLKARLVRTGVYTVNESNLTIVCPNGAEIHFKTADKADNLYGEDVYAAVFDEAPRAKVESWYALRSTLTATGAPCKMIGNFGGLSNWMHKLKEKSFTDPEYAYFKINCYDAVKEGILTIEEVNQAKKDLPPKIFNELYLAEASEDNSQLIQNESITKMQNNIIEPGVKYITGDIARLGKDKTIIFVWDGLRVIDHTELALSTIPQSVDAIKTLMLKYNVNINNVIVDEDGVGGGVKDMLSCQGFINNSRPIKIKGKIENFASLKDQCYYKLAEMVNRNEIAVDVPDKLFKMLQEELEMVRLPSGIDLNKIKMLSKQEIKKVIGRSPDYSDALMMRMYYLLDPHKGSYYY
tara:strand:+ start:6985 stop:8253 length:1269 start_codon:yes stop_codon:yes gene_type:complete